MKNEKFGQQRDRRIQSKKKLKAFNEIIISIRGLRPRDRMNVLQAATILASSDNL